MNPTRAQEIIEYIRKEIKRPTDWCEDYAFTRTKTKISDYVTKLLKKEDDEIIPKDIDKFKVLKEHFNLKPNILDRIVRLDLIENYFSPDKFGRLEQLITPSTSPFKNTPKESLIRLCLTLFELDLPAKFAQSREVALSLLEQELVSSFINFYLTNKSFTEIQIIGDIEKKVPRLSMEDYFMDLAYLESKEIDNPDDLIRKEQENLRQKISRNNYSHSYITDSILYNENRVVISGNPGTGKSTFAHYLCYTWAKKTNEEQIVPIYISLRELEAKGLNLEEYISDKYLDHESLEIEIAGIRKFLKKKHIVRLVLDGLDELSDSKKRSLYCSICNLGLEENYILLSRPYALYSNDFEQIPHIEIVGYTENNRDRYIELMISNAEKTLIQQHELLEIIDNNPILTDLSYNPLMLSYIILYCFNSYEKSGLEKIQSTYEMQEWIIDKISHYSGKRDQSKAVEIDEESKEEIAFAYHLMMEQKFVYEGKRNDQFKQAASNLSKAGMGKLVYFNNTGKWSFNFHSITIQEYLAANFIGPIINKESFTYLSKFPFYHEFCKMIIGYTAIHSSKSCYSFLYSTFNNSEIKFNLFINLLAEAGEIEIDLVLNDFNKFINILKSKRKHLYINNKSFNAIYSKASNKQAIKTYLITNLEAEILNYKHSKSTHGKLIIELIKAFKLYLDLDFFLNYINVLNRMIPLLNSENLYRTKEIINIWFMPFFSQFNNFEEYEKNIIEEKLDNFCALLKNQHSKYIFELGTAFLRINNKPILYNLLNNEFEQIKLENASIYHYNKLCIIIKHLESYKYSISHSPVKLRESFSLLIIKLIHYYQHVSKFHKGSFFKNPQEKLYDIYLETRPDYYFKTDIRLYKKYGLINILKYSDAQLNIFFLNAIDILKKKPERFIQLFEETALHRHVYNEYINLYCDSLNLMLLKQQSFETCICFIIKNNQNNLFFQNTILKSKLMTNQVFIEEYLSQFLINTNNYNTSTWEIIKKHIKTKNNSNFILNILGKSSLYNCSNNISHLTYLWTKITDDMSLELTSTPSIFDTIFRNYPKNIKNGFVINKYRMDLSEIAIQTLFMQFINSSHLRKLSPIIHRIKEIYTPKPAKYSAGTILNTLLLDYINNENTYKTHYLKHKNTLNKDEKLSLEKDLEIIIEKDKLLELYNLPGKDFFKTIFNLNSGIGKDIYNKEKFKYLLLQN